MEVSQVPTPTEESEITKKVKEFKMTKYVQRRVALKIAYLGWNYHGFVSQDHTPDTVEVIL